jgi:YNFM family putative membrane transporter
VETERTTASQDVKRSSAIAALYLATVAIYADMYITQPILPLLSDEFAVAPATAGLTISAVVVMIAIASSVYGPLSDALGRKPVMVWSCVLLVVPTLLCALAPSFGSLLLLRALQGVLIPGVTAVSVAYIGDQFSVADIGGIIGGLVSAAVVGGLLGRVASGLIADFVHWRAAFVVFAGVTLFGALAMGYTLPQGSASEAVGWSRAYQGMFAHFRNRRLVGAFLIGGTLFFAFLGLFTYLPYYLTDAPFHLSASMVSGIYLVYLAGVIVSPLSGRLSARISRRTIMGAGLIIAILGVVGTLSPSLPLIILSLIVLCAGMWTTQSTAPTFVNTVAQGAKGGAGALYNMFFYIGATFGSVLPGYAWQVWGWPGVVSICTTSLVLAFLSNWVLCRDNQQRDADPG